MVYLNGTLTHSTALVEISRIERTILTVVFVRDGEACVLKLGNKIFEIHFLEGLALVSAEIAIVTFAHGSIAIIPIHIEKFEVSVNLIPIWCGSYHTRLSSHYKIVAVYLKFDHVHIVKAVRYFGVIKSCYFHGITSLFVIILYHNEGRTWTFQAEYH